MDIQRTGAFEPVSKLQRNITRRENPAAPTDGQDFSQTDALRGALDNLPSSRPERVQRARELAEQIEYPPAKTIRQLSDLLAVKMQGPMAL
ncbi:MAG: hypothetical protein RIT19_2760 [Verrucomicrobiota bacterium]|jgi:hypothetical protein